MKNIFKAFANATSSYDRRSHDVILTARRAARDARIDPQAGKWGTHIGETTYRTLL